MTRQILTKNSNYTKRYVMPESITKYKVSVVLENAAKGKVDIIQPIAFFELSRWMMSTIANIRGFTIPLNRLWHSAKASCSKSY